MRITKVAVAVPSKAVANTDILNIIRETSALQDDATVLRVVGRLLAGIGTNTRYWLAENESSFELTLQAGREALGGLPQGEEVDLLLYASVYKLGIVEPAAANLVAHGLGLRHVKCFDVTAACDGFMKALEIAQNAICAGQARNVLIVNSEFSMIRDYAIAPDLFALDAENWRSQLEHRLPAYTIGEAATAALVTGSKENVLWGFKNETDNALYPLCSVTTRSFIRYPGMSEKLATDGPGLFTSWASDLSNSGIPLVIAAAQACQVDPRDVDILVTHASGCRDWRHIASELGLSDKLYDIHTRYGNLVSASIPAALAFAEKEGKLEPGMRVFALVGSAGMTATAVHFRWEPT